MKRNNIIDLTKGIGIFLVILGHNESPLTAYIYSFHMPLFFLISGMFHSSEKNYTIFMKKKIKSLLIPYISFSIPLFLFWVVIGRKFGESVIKNTPISHSMVGILVGTDIAGFSSVEWGTPLWFLLCIFVVNNIFFYISKLSNTNIIIFNIVFILLNIILSKFLRVRLPWSILTALTAFPFYSFGYLFKEKILDNQINNKHWIITFIFFLLSILAYKLNGRIDMFENYYKNILFFFIGGFSGSLVLINLMKLLPQNKYKWINFLGVNSLILLAFHGRAMTILKFIWVIILKKEFIEGPLIFAFIYSFFQILLCLPLIFIINNYAPFLLGRKNINKVESKLVRE